MEPDVQRTLMVGLVFLAGAVIVYLIGLRILRPLRPPLIMLEFATSPKLANWIRTQWQQAKLVRRAIVAIVIQVLLLIPLYTIAALPLTVALWESNRTAVNFFTGVFIAGVLVVSLVHMAENAGLLVTLLFGARAAVVFGTRLLAWLKYTIAALTVLYGFVRAEVYLYGLLVYVPGPVLAGLIVLTLTAALAALRQATRLSRDRPPLLALQLAPSPLAAKDVLERWGDRGRKTATSALLLQSAFAVLYGLTLATICERLVVDTPVLQRLAMTLGTGMLIAAACHLAQNAGALVAVRRREIGWWAGSMRALGRVRLVLLGAAAVYFVALLLRLEWSWVRWTGETIAGWKS